jgi:hypothetical protein
VHLDPKNWWMIPKNYLKKILYLEEGCENTKIYAKTFAITEIFMKAKIFTKGKFLQKAKMNWLLVTTA